MKILGTIFKVLFALLSGLIIIAAIWLKTESTNKLVKKTIISIFEHDLKLSAKIDDLRISLPLIIDIGSFEVREREDLLGEIKNLHINILPALDSFWKITFWSISASEVVVNKIPESRDADNRENERSEFKRSGLFNPDIFIREIAIDSIKLLPAVTGLKDSFSFTLNSYIEYNNFKRQISLNTHGNLISLGNNEYEILGSYNISKELLDLKLAKIHGQDNDATIKLFMDKKENTIDGSIDYRSNMLGQLLTPYLQESDIGIAKGEVRINGRALEPKIIINGDIEIKSLPLKHNAELSLSKERGEGFLKINYDKINASGNILYKDQKLSLPNFVITGEDFEETNNLNLDLTSMIVTGDASFVNKNLALMTKYFPYLKGGAVNIKAVFSSIDNIKQQLSINGKFTNLAAEDFNLGNGEINFHSTDLWQKKFNDLVVGLKSINIAGYLLDEVKLSAAMRGKNMNIDGRIISKDFIPLNLNFNASLKAYDEGNNVSLSKPIDLSINTLNGTICTGKIKNSDKISILIDDKTTIKMNKLKVDEGTLSINAVIDSLSTNVNAALKDVTIQSLINVIGHKIAGRLSGDVNVQIANEGATLGGNLKLSGGKYDYKLLGVKIKNITSNIQVSGKQINFNDISGNDNSGNVLKGSGIIDLTNEFLYKFNFTTPKFSPANAPFMYGEIKGNIAIDGNKNEAIAKGQLTIGPFEIKIPENFSHDIPQLNTIEETEEVAEESNYPFKFDIDLLTTDKVFVRGAGVDTRLAGSLKINGDIDDPVVKGILSSNHGKYQEFGKILTIKKGELIFDGTIPPSPFLNIVGVYNNANTEIRVILAGSIQKPKVSIESTPAMSEEEALKTLLFGQNIANPSPFQALQLADSARRLSGHGGGIDPVSFGRKFLKVDDINFRTDEANPENSSLGIGKHINDMFYVEVERGRQADSSKVRIEMQVSPKISIENVTKQAGGTSLGINWKFDY